MNQARIKPDSYTPQKRQEYNKKWYDENKERKKEINKKYYQRRKQKLLSMKQNNISS